MARAFLKLKRRAFVTLLARYWRLKTQAMCELRRQHELQLAKKIVHEGYEVPRQHQVGARRCGCVEESGCSLHCRVIVRSGAERRCSNAVHAWLAPASLCCLIAGGGLCWKQADYKFCLRGCSCQAGPASGP